MTKNRFLTFFLLLLVASSVFALPIDDGVVSMKIQGKAPDFMKGQMLELIRRGNLNEVKDKMVDSVWVRNDGTFVFTHTGKANQVLTLSAGVLDAPIVMEKGTVTVDLSNIGCNLGGTPQNDALRDFVKGSGEILRQRGLADGEVEKDSTLSKEILALKYDSITQEAVSKAVVLTLPVIRKYSNSELAEYAMQECMRWTGENVGLFDSLYNAMGRREVTMPRLQQVIRRMEHIRQTSPGMMFRDFTVAQGNLNGTPAKLSDYVGRGKYVLLDFWASWCIWCRAEFPTLAEVYAKHKDDNFEIVGLVVDDRLEDTKAALKKEPMVVWPQIVNAGVAERTLYGVEGIPEIILFAPDGRIVARGLRGERLVKTVDAALKE